MAISFCDDVKRLCRRAPSCSKVIKLRNACFYPHYRHKLILFALSPLRLALGSAYHPPLPEGGIEDSISLIQIQTCPITVAEVSKTISHIEF